MSDETRAPGAEEDRRRQIISGLAMREVGGQRRRPIESREILLADKGAKLTFSQGQLRTDPECVLNVNGRDMPPNTILSIGDRLEIDGKEWELESWRAPARLYCYTAPHLGRSWGLGFQATADIGRRGKRSNDIELDDPTVSRAQAQILTDPDGLILRAESVTFLNGQKLEPGEQRRLDEGDLVRFGETVCRLHLERADDAQCLRLVCLGRFEATHFGVAIESAQWQTHHARFLLAYLAYRWPDSVSTERVMEDFWPQLEPDRRKANLRLLISRLRKAVDRGTGQPLLHRAGAVLGIAPQFPLQADICQLRQALGKGDRRLALDLYTGPFLEDCYLEWAVRLRSDLESQLLAAALELAVSSHQPAEKLFYARKALDWDPCAEVAAEQAMEALRLLGRPEEALRLYETLVRNLRQELDVEPGEKVAEQLALVKAAFAR